jgi:hypothetical protein
MAIYIPKTEIKISDVGHMKGVTIFLPKYINNKKFCELLKINIKEAKRMRDEGEISYTQIKGRFWYSLVDVVNCINKK